MVWKPRELVLLVPDNSDSTQYRTMFYWAYATCGEGVQCIASILHISYDNELVGKLWQDFLDIVSFPVFGAFQIVLLYLFGQSVIAVDMFLNLVTTNPGEALELLDNLIPAIIIVVLLYIPALVLAAVAVSKKRRLSETFVRRERKRARITVIAGILSLVAAYLFDARYELKSDLYPANVCYNIALAFQRTAQTQHYAETSKDFTFQAKTTRPEKNREVYVMVIGETSRAANWSIYGYNRNTNPELTK